MQKKAKGESHSTESITMDKPSNSQIYDKFYKHQKALTALANEASSYQALQNWQRSNRNQTMSQSTEDGKDHTNTENKGDQHAASSSRIEAVKINSKAVRPCRVCSFLVPSSSLDYQELIYHTQSLGCTLIAEIYMSLMQQHVSVYGASLEECVECKEKFSTPTGLLKHIYDHAVTKAGVLQPLPATDTTHETVSTLEQPYNTDNQLQITAAMPEQPSETTTQKIATACTTRKLIQKRRNVPVMWQAKKKKRILCELCGDLFCDEKAVQTHIEIVHNKVYRYKCPICDKSFGRKSQLKAHRGRHKPYVCNICNKSIVNKPFYDLHMAAHRNGEKPFKCNQCGKGFMAKNYLENHQVTHSGQKPFECSICGIGYMTEQKLKNHMKRHLGTKHFKCTVCAKEFYSQEDLTCHMRHHKSQKPHLCDFCGKSFLKPGRLKSHMATHNVRPSQNKEQNAGEHSHNVSHPLYNERKEMPQNIHQSPYLSHHTNNERTDVQHNNYQHSFAAHHMSNELEGLHHSMHTDSYVPHHMYNDRGHLQLNMPRDAFVSHPMNIERNDLQQLNIHPGSFVSHHMSIESNDIAHHMHHGPFGSKYV
ncbi:Zinc finger protein [Plakobranchus ocellatus]|uniref:Zinc finger protein n=1 Tax=Plakobranchus ocellatus TaxID=259542 RepID=A0AAV4DH34_9GAST|nr:Zinc finger protein [Plakobranchus ocellatus]